MKILLSCYSFGAGKGSEPGVGWNVAVGLARRGHDVTVVTTGEFADSNKSAMESLGVALRVFEWSCGLSGFHLASTYKKWQKRVKGKMLELIANNQFDLVHHVDFNQYRSIYFIQKCGLPYLVGPVGGAETVALKFLKEYPLKDAVKEIIRHCGLDAIPLGIRSRKSRGIYIASNTQTQKRLKRWAGIDALLGNAIGVSESEIVRGPVANEGSPFFIYAGRMVPDKGVHVLMRAFAKLWHEGTHIPLRIVGCSEQKDWDRLKKWASRLNLPEESLEIMPFIARKELMAMIPQSVAFIHPAFRDSGSMAVVEALATGATTICFDIASQGWLRNDLGIKVSQNGDVIENLKTALKDSIQYSQEKDAGWHERRVRFLTEKMTWDARAVEFEHYYSLLLKKEQ